MAAGSAVTRIDTLTESSVALTKSSVVGRRGLSSWQDDDLPRTTQTTVRVLFFYHKYSQND